MTQKENGKKRNFGGILPSLVRLANVFRIQAATLAFRTTLLRLRRCASNTSFHVYSELLLFLLFRFHSNHLLPVVATRRIWLCGIIHNKGQTTERSAIAVSHNALSSRNVWINAVAVCQICYGHFAHNLLPSNRKLIEMRRSGINWAAK